MMTLARGRYALRIMTNLAERIGSFYIPLKDIAERQQISEKYLESIVKVLVRNGLLDALCGRSGGCRLDRSPAKYTVGSIFRLTGGSLAPAVCLEEETACERMTYCRTLPMWQKLDRLVNDFFDGYTLAGLAAPNPAGDDFVI